MAWEVIDWPLIPCFEVSLPRMRGLRPMQRSSSALLAAALSGLALIDSAFPRGKTRSDKLKHPQERWSLRSPNRSQRRPSHPPGRSHVGSRGVVQAMRQTERQAGWVLAGRTIIGLLGFGLLAFTLSTRAVRSRAVPWDIAVVATGALLFTAAILRATSRWKHGIWALTIALLMSSLAATALWWAVTELVLKQGIAYSELFELASSVNLSMRVSLLVSCIAGGGLVALMMSHWHDLHAAIDKIPLMMFVALTLCASTSLYSASEGIFKWNSEVKTNNSEVVVFTSGLEEVTVEVTYGWDSDDNDRRYFDPPMDDSGGLSATYRYSSLPRGADAKIWIAVADMSAYGLEVMPGSARFVGTILPEHWGDCGRGLVEFLPKSAMKLYVQDAEDDGQATINVRGSGGWMREAGSSNFYQPPGVIFLGGRQSCAAIPVDGFPRTDLKVAKRSLRTQFYGSLPADSIVERVNPDIDRMGSGMGHDLVWVNASDQALEDLSLNPTFLVSTGETRGRASGLLFLSGVSVGVFGGSLLLLPAPAIYALPALGKQREGAMRPGSASVREDVEGNGRRMRRDTRTPRPRLRALYVKRAAYRRRRWNRE